MGVLSYLDIGTVYAKKSQITELLNQSIIMHMTPINHADALPEQQLECSDDFDEPTPGLLTAVIGTGIAVLLMVLNFI